MGHASALLPRSLHGGLTWGQGPCPTALPHGLTYLPFPSYSGSLSAPGGGAEGPGARSLVQQLLDEGWLCVGNCTLCPPRTCPHLPVCADSKPQVGSLWSEAQVEETVGPDWHGPGPPVLEQDKHSCQASRF